jgi:hypothetical protein
VTQSLCGSRFYLDLNNLIGPGIFLPRLENPLFLIPIALFSRSAWKLSERRWRRYFLATFLPLLVLFIPFGFADMFRNFSLAVPAMTLIALSAAGQLDGAFKETIVGGPSQQFRTTAQETEAH